MARETWWGTTGGPLACTRQLRVRMRGDQVSALANLGADLTFFDPLD